MARDAPDNWLLRSIGNAMNTLLLLAAIGFVPDVGQPAAAAFSRSGVRFSNGSIRLVNANPSDVRGEGLLPGVNRYFSGGGRRSATIPFQRVRYVGAYKGIDVLFYSNENGEIEFDFFVAPGADPDQIEIELNGVELKDPTIFTQPRTPVKGRYVKRGSNRVGIALDRYDRTKELVIDPVVRFSSYLGANGGVTGESIALDSDGNIYVTGTVASNTFPLENPAQSIFMGSNDIFITKLDPTGTRLIYSTYFGSWGDDQAKAIAVDVDGNAYITGFTSSPDFPVMNAVQPNFGGGAVVNGGDAFVVKLGPTGDLLFSTFLGGTLDDFGRAIAIDPDGNIRVAGTTASLDFPTVNPYQAKLNGSARDVFMTKLSGDGSAILYSSYFGGTAAEEGNAIAVDAEGNWYIAGATSSTNMPVKNPAQTRYGTNRDAFVAKFSADGKTLLFATFLGGTADDWARGIALDSTGNVYVTGYTANNTFPVKNPFKTFGGGTRDAFIAKYANDGTLLYSSCLGGSSTDEGFAVAVDANDDLYIAGFSQSLDFPLLSPVQAAIPTCKTQPCTADLFVTKVNSAGTALMFSTYFGGTGADQPRAMAVSADGNVVVTGTTASTNFPVSAPYQDKNTGGGAAIGFLLKLN